MCWGWLRMFNLLIDKLSVVFTIPEDNEKYEHYSWVMNFISIMGSEKHKVWKSEYTTKCSIDLGAGNTLMIQAGISHNRLYIKFEFNPNKLSKTEWGDLYSHMSLLMDYGYHTLHEKGRVNYIEIAADAPDLEFAGLFFYDEKLRNANNTYWKQGTIYLGSEKSSRSFIAYDKTKQLKDCFGQELGHSLTRIEARLTNLTLTLGELEQLSNPFESLHVGRMLDLQEKKGDSVWGLFKKRCLTMGVQDALSLAGAARKKMLQTLAEVAKPELNPSQSWGQFPTALNILKPPACIY